MPRLSLGIALLLCVSCGGDDARRFIELALDEGNADSVVLVVSDSSQPTRVFASRALELSVTFSADRDAPLELWALLFRQPPEELDLSPGEITEALQRPGACFCHLLSPVRMFSAKLDASADQVSSWTEVTALPERVKESLVGDYRSVCSPCSDFDVELVELPTTSRVAGAVEDRDGAGLILTEDGSLFRVTTDDPPELVCSASAPDPLVSGRRRGDSLWAGTVHGKLIELPLDQQDASGPCSIATSTQSPSTRDLSWLDVAPPEAPFELFALSREDSPRVLRFDGTGWTKLGSIALTSSPPHAAIVWTGSGEGLAVASGPDVFFITPSGLESFRVSEGANEFPLSIAADIDGFGMVLAADLVGLLFERNPGWSLAQGNKGLGTVASPPSALIGFKDGLFFATDRGFVEEYVTQEPYYCGAISTGGSASSERLVSLGNDIILDADLHRGDVPKSQPTQYAILRPKGGRCL